jgi:hypothetical protein
MLFEKHMGFYGQCRIMVQCWLILLYSMVDVPTPSSILQLFNPTLCLSSDTIGKKKGELEIGVNQAG